MKRIIIALASIAAVATTAIVEAQTSPCVSGGVVPSGNDALTADCKTDNDGDGSIVISTPTPLPASSISEMVKRVRPAVVKISAPGYQPYAIGSGFIFATVPTKKTAYLLTNYHVVEGEPKLAVMVNDSDWYEPTITFLDARRDLAVLEICCDESFVSVPFADSDELNAGDDVIAIGYPRDTAMPRNLTLSRTIIPGEASVTKGMISAFRYSSLMDAQLIQTDTAVSSGNSGGPLLTLDGQVVAMNTLASNHHPGDGVTQNINFSVLETTIQEKLRIWAEGPVSEFGPADVSIPDDADDGLIGLYSLADFEATDDEFQVKATFVNPSTPFSYGFMFGIGEDDDDPLMSFVVHSGKEWSLHIYEPQDGWSTILSGTVPQLNIRRGAKNTLRILVDGKYGALTVNSIPVYLNDEPISAHTDLGGEHNVTTHGGEVELITGYWNSTGKDSPTTVEDVIATTYSHQPPTTPTPVPTSEPSSERRISTEAVKTIAD